MKSLLGSLEEFDGCRAQFRRPDIAEGGMEAAVEGIHSEDRVAFWYMVLQSVCRAERSLRRRHRKQLQSHQHKAEANAV